MHSSQHVQRYLSRLCSRRSAPLLVSFTPGNDPATSSQTHCKGPAVGTQLQCQARRIQSLSIPWPFPWAWQQRRVQGQALPCCPASDALAAQTCRQCRAAQAAGALAAGRGGSRDPSLLPPSTCFSSMWELSRPCPSSPGTPDTHGLVLLLLSPYPTLCDHSQGHKLAGPGWPHLP